MIKVAVGVLLNDQNQILIAKRPLHKPYPGLWEFPGGKIEENESPLEALHREFLEELQIRICNNADSHMPFHEIKYDQQPSQAVHLLIFKITEFIGDPIGAEGQEIKWIEQRELVDYEFPIANQEIIQVLIQQNKKIK